MTSICDPCVEKNRKGIQKRRKWVEKVMSLKHVLFSLVKSVILSPEKFLLSRFEDRDFSGDPVAKTLGCQCRGLGSIPGQGNRPHVLQPATGTAKQGSKHVKRRRRLCLNPCVNNNIFIKKKIPRDKSTHLGTPYL